MIVKLEYNEWQYIMGILAERPWKESNTVLMKLGNQVRTQLDNIKEIKKTNE
jgi:hypothetical protein